jgi:hypothetical protein
MINHPVRPLNSSITGVSALVGRTVSVDEWAREFRIPNRKVPGAFLTGEDMNRITGIEGKSWDPEEGAPRRRITSARWPATPRSRAEDPLLHPGDGGRPAPAKQHDSNQSACWD